MQVYIAAPYPWREDAIGVMVALEGAGIGCTASWLRQVEEMTDAAARLDLADVDRADVLVALNPPGWEDRGTGGRHVELGYALAKQKRVVLVGHSTNIFHYLSDVVQVQTPGDILPALRGLTLHVDR